jgi:hypothetical protein
MAQTDYQGCCYTDFGDFELDRWRDKVMGKDARWTRRSGHHQDRRK